MKFQIEQLHIAEGLRRSYNDSGYFFDQEIIIWVDFDLNGAGLDLMKEDIGLVWAGNNNLG